MRFGGGVHAAVHAEHNDALRGILAQSKTVRLFSCVSMCSKVVTKLMHASENAQAVTTTYLIHAHFLFAENADNILNLI